MKSIGCPYINEFYEAKAEVQFIKHELVRPEISDKDRAYWQKRLKVAEVSLADARADVRAVFDRVEARKRKHGLPVHQTVAEKMIDFR